MSKAIYWFNRDLRVHDNQNLAKACAENKFLLPVFVIDSRYWAGNFTNGMPKMSEKRKTFLLQCLQNLKQNLQKEGSDLLILLGEPLAQLTQLSAKTGITQLYCADEPGYNEQKIISQLEDTFSVEKSYDGFLYNPNLVPFSVDATPDVFSKFRGKCEKYGEIPDELTAESFPPLPENIDVEFSLFSAELQKATESNLRFNGGEDAAWERLNYYFEESKLLAVYKETRNGLLGDDYSSKFSPWLALGCISPISIYYQVKEFEEINGSTQNTYWLIFELLWRDYFRYISLKFGRNLFTEGGLKLPNNLAKMPVEPSTKFEKWCNGQTGFPFVDANMIELKETGFMSNRGRQNVASFLVKDLNIDWRLGAAYFEHHLLDFCPNSNYGNWLYVAGLGNDPREDRYFNVLIQGERYDADSAYIKHWIPKLKNLDAKTAQQPWRDASVDYFKPLVKVKHGF